ncbi:MAG TPA: DoxX family membrane protein, partial [Propionicimonas sp.]|nr:DoxX family membrane protein [Propionicimonas sp.]
APEPVMPAAPEPVMPAAPVLAAPVADMPPAADDLSSPDPEPAEEAAPAASAGPILPAVPVWTPPAEPESAPEPVGGADIEPEAQPEDPAAVLLPPPPQVQVAPEPVAPAPTPTESVAASGTSWATPPEEPIPGAGDIFRNYGEPSSTEAAALSDEERKLAAERAARRDARSAALTAAGAAETMVDGTPTAAPAPAAAAPAPVKAMKQKTDRFWGSLGLFLVRLALAVIFGVRGTQMLLDPTATQKLFGSTALPSPDLMGVITAAACLLIAVSMVMGLATRYSAAGATLIAVGSLAFYYWGSFSVFVEGQFGFLGESSLLIAAVGLLLVFIGGGGWSLDRSLRSAREADKVSRAIVEE